MKSIKEYLFRTLAAPMMIGTAALFITGGVGFAQVGPLQLQEEKSKRAEEDALRLQALAGEAEQCFSSGSGSTFLKVCITNRGNISTFESPVGKSHIFIREGYIACFVNQFGVLEGAFDAGSAEGGWGPPTVSQPNGPGKFPLTIKRDILSGRLRLTQTFTMIASDRELQVTMALKNITSSQFSAVVVERYFDGDLDNSSSNDLYDQSNDSVWGVNGTSHTTIESNSGLMLTQAPLAGVELQPRVQPFEIWNPNGTAGQTARACGGSTLKTPTSGGDSVGRLSTTFGVLKAGQTKTVTYRYRRF